MSDFQPQGQPGLNQKLQQIVRDLAEIDKLRYLLLSILDTDSLMLRWCSGQSVKYNSGSFLPHLKYPVFDL